jgi:hypothetical protein
MGIALCDYSPSPFEELKILIEEAIIERQIASGNKKMMK